MITRFDFGPRGRIELILKGEAKEKYNTFDSLTEQVQDSLQLLCHAVIQLEDTIAQSEAGVLWVDRNIMILGIKDDYVLSNFDTGMTIMTLNKRNKGCYSTEFFSVKQMALTDPIISYAYEDLYRNGRHG